MVITHKIQLLARFPTWPGSPPLYVLETTTDQHPPEGTFLDEQKATEAPSGGLSNVQWRVLAYVTTRRCNCCRRRVVT